ncbi:high mobility group box domain-containing protein [Rhizophagus irregularis DAOM 181602=DAOM 197198]|nr:high mobility group box domain-containing protein [Rhizophagus irregularis DAOM 181602=DAOM 197198]
MGHFKPVIKTQVASAVTNTSSSSSNDNKNNSPPTPPNDTAPTTVSVSTQKSRKNQKVSDGQIKKAATPRKKRTNKKTVATKATVVEEASTEKISNSHETKPNVAMSTPEGSTAASTPDGALPASASKATRKRKSKSNKNNDNLQIEANNHESESKPKRARKAKDPNAPKRPLNAYLRFSLVKRAELKQQNPGMGPKEITIMLGEAWRKLSEDEKKTYHDLVTQAFVQWQEDMKAYQASIGIERVQYNREQNTVRANESADINPSTEEISAQDNIQLISQANTTDSTYDLYDQRDSMEDFLDMADNSQAYGYRSTNTDMNGTHLYMDSLPSTMIPIQVGIVNQDAHNSYYIQDLIPTHQEREQNQVAKQDLLLCQPFDPSAVNQELESNVQENPIIQKQERPDANNMLLCQPFEPSDNKVMTDNDNDDSWLQDGTQYQNQIVQHTQQEFSESMMYSQVPQYEQQFQEHAPQQSEEIPLQELQHIEMYQQSLHHLIL